MKKVLKSICALFLSVGLVACNANPGSATGKYTPGTYTGTAKGYGGDVNVTITVDASSITDVTVVGDQETEGIGKAALEELAGQVKTAQSSEIDGVTGATSTSNGVKAAAADAINQASGVSSTTTSEVKMIPGTYSSEAYGFNMGWSDKVEVTVDETKITDIKFGEDCGDTPPMLAMVENLMFARMIENQSYAIDSISGATATSNAAREAVKTALQDALAAGGADAGAIENFNITPEKPGGSSEVTTQVVVIGMGGSGVYTALSAAEQGLEVLCLEQEGRYGGTTALTSEIEAINPPRIQDEYNNGENYTDADVMKAAWLEYVEGDAKPEMIDLFFENSGPALDWLSIDHGIQFDYDAKVGFTPSDVYRVKFQWYPNTSDKIDSAVFGANKAEIAANFDSLVKDYTDLGGEYMLETKVDSIIYDENGAAIGVVAHNLVTGEEITVHADAVVSATGGFLGSAEMTEKYLSDEYYPLKGAWNSYGSKGNDGTILKDMIEIGHANTYNIGMPPEVHMSGSAQFIPASAGYEIHEIEGKIGNFSGVQSVWSVADAPMYLGIAPNSLAVGTDGKRFTAETGVAMLDPWIAGPNYYSIYSTTQLDDVKDNGFKYNNDGVASGFLGYLGAIPTETPLPELYDVLQTAQDMGFVYKADTIEELADMIGVPADALAETVTQYNGFVEAGNDSELNKDPQYLETIGDGPYYAIKMASYSYNTVAGVEVDTNLQVIDTNGNPIPGLFAVGSDSAGVLFSEKKPYVTYGGANNGWALTSGYLAGMSLAKYIEGLK